MHTGAPQMPYTHACAPERKSHYFPPKSRVCACGMEGHEEKTFQELYADNNHCFRRQSHHKKPKDAKARYEASTDELPPEEPRTYVQDFCVEKDKALLSHLGLRGSELNRSL